jgi:hypothetical protein
LSLIRFISDEEEEGDTVCLGESMWPICIVRVVAAVGSVVIEGLGGAGNASSVVGIAADADADAGGGVGVVVA